MANIIFQLVTPEKILLQKELLSLSCPTEMGEITILPGHISLIATLVPGELRAKTSKDEFFIYVSGGFVEVRPGNEVVILADSAQHHYEIDEKEAVEAKARAEKTMSEKQMSAEEYAKVAATLQQSLAKLNIARKHAHRKQSVTHEGIHETTD